MKRLLISALALWAFSARVAAAYDFSLVQIFPVPWEPGSRGKHDAPSVSFTGLAFPSTVKIYGIRGEFIWKADASPAGAANWDGKNNHGAKVATGTYLAVLEAGGARFVRRLMVVR